MKRLNNIVLCITGLALFVFLHTYRDARDRSTRTTIAGYAQVLAEPLWKIDNALVDVYLKVIIDRQNYASLQVLDNKDVVFAAVTAPESNRLHKMLSPLGLLPRRQISADILMQGENIGTVNAIWLDTSIYAFAYAFLIALLLTFISRLYVRIMQINRALEEKIHGQQEAMAEIERQKKYIEDIFQVFPQGLIAVNQDETCIEHNIYFNAMVSTWAERTGLEPSAVKKSFFSRLQQELREHELGRYEINLGGKAIHFEFSSSQVPDLPEIDKVVTLRDITNQVTMEQQLILAEKLSSIAGLAEGVAHEINTPLSAITQSVQLIELSIDPEPEANRQAAAAVGLDLRALARYLHEEKLDYFLHGIHGSAIKASDIIQKLLQFSRPMQGTHTTTDLKQLLDQALKFTRNDYILDKQAFQKVLIKKEYSDNLPTISAVPMEIEQAMCILLKNALQSLLTNGQPNPKLILRTGADSHFAWFSVEDNGPGMDKESIKRIFDPFYTTREVGEGTGLGLSIAHTIIHDKHRGKIEVQSILDKGTVFTVYLPIEMKSPRS